MKVMSFYAQKMSVRMGAPCCKNLTDEPGSHHSDISGANGFLPPGLAHVLSGAPLPAHPAIPEDQGRGGQEVCLCQPGQGKERWGWLIHPSTADLDPSIT